MSNNPTTYGESYRAAASALARLYAGTNDYKRKMKTFRLAYASQPDDEARDAYAARVAEAKAREVRR